MGWFAVRFGSVGSVYGLRPFEPFAAWIGVAWIGVAWFAWFAYGSNQRRALRCVALDRRGVAWVAGVSGGGREWREGVSGGVAWVPRFSPAPPLLFIYMYRPRRRKNWMKKHSFFLHTKKSSIFAAYLKSIRV